MKNSLKRTFAKRNYITFMLVFPIVLASLFVVVFSNMEALEEQGKKYELQEDITEEEISSKIYSLSFLESVKPVRDFSSPASQIAATMLVFSILFQSQHSLTQVYYLRKNIGKRILVAPVSKLSIYIGEFLGSLLVVLLEGIVVSVCLESFFSLGLSNHVGQLFVILLCCSMMATAIGMAIGIVIKDEMIASSVVTILILIEGFSSGGFTPGLISFKESSSFSFFTYITKGILDICRLGKVQEMGELMGITLGIGSVSLGLATLWQLRNKKWGEGK